MPRKQTSRTQSLAVADRCRDAYSADRYASWPEVARVLLRMGFDEAETEAVMRSKITRWAADNHPNRYGKVPARVVREYITSDEARRGCYRVRQEIAVWADEHRKEVALCEWFAGCTAPATGVTPHPVIGSVPTCDRCHTFATGTKPEGDA